MSALPAAFSPASTVSERLEDEPGKLLKKLLFDDGGDEPSDSSRLELSLRYEKARLDVVGPVVGPVTMQISECTLELLLAVS